MTKEKTIQITIDNKKIDAWPNQTILQAARKNNVYIPSLCAMEHLSSYGACRLCVVEVDGLRGFPTSCTTPVEEGMVIRTDTAEVRSLRQEVLKLLLSEHPASCLFCTEQDECKQYMGTIRKVGATTGCRYCPNDHRCELQQIAENIGLTETSYPVYYRNFPVEKYDPFYDRDYNLCILCGRCVRVCNNVRLNGTLSFKQRGRVTTIGPAFERSHIDAGCEFCGACVTACPTGALSVKVSKWYGRPEGQVATTCNYCSAGCRLILQMTKTDVIDALPDYDSAVEHGIICVKGRFGITEYVHSPLRYGTPKEMTPVGYNNISWEEAIAKAAGKLSGLKPDDCLIVVSPQLLNEDLFVAQQFIRQVTGSEEVASSFIFDLDGDAAPFINLALASEPFETIEKAQGILAVGFDSTYGYSPIGVKAKQAAQAGASLMSINSFESNLDLLSGMAFVVDSSRWADVLDLTMSRMSKGKAEKRFADLVEMWGSDIDKTCETFSRSSHNVLIVGPGIIDSPDRGKILRSIERMKNEYSWKVVVAHQYTNLAGMFAMGACPGIKPGEMIKEASADKAVVLKAELIHIDLRKKRKLIYLVGDASFDSLPECEFLIYQNALPVQFSRQPDLILPVSLFTEASGTVISAEGRVLQVKEAVAPYMDSKPDWWILKSIAEKMSKGKMKFNDVFSIQREIKKIIKGFPAVKKRIEFKKIEVKGNVTTHGKGKPAAWKSSYRGIPLGEVVSGIKVIELNSTHRPGMSPDNSL
jgi:NADH dehydrogenase/NADH:ubiquinone oxidoreductase subunit G